MKNISIDNGHSYTDLQTALDAFSLDVMAQYMEDEAREAASLELAPCTDLEFLQRYLEIAENDLVIG